LIGKGSRKTLRAKPNDKVFINFVDHGAPGLIIFPNSELHEDTLINTFNKMT